MGERSGWQLASGSVAESYERYIMSAFGNAWAQALVQLAEPDDGERVLDVACGTGAVARITRYPSLGEYVLGYLSGTPMAGAVAALGEMTRTAMVEHVCTSLRAYVDDEGMAAPWEAHLVTAHS